MSTRQTDPGAFLAFAIGGLGAFFTYTSLGGITTLDLSALIAVLAAGGVWLGSLVAYGRIYK